MNVCVVAEYYPRRRDPVLGIWAHGQALAARNAGADVRVLALERPIPPLRTLRSPPALARALRGIFRQPRVERRDGIEITYVRFLAPPRQRSYTRWDRWARPGLERALAELDAEWHVDLVHAHYALPAGGAVESWAKAHGRPLVVSVHGGDVFGALLEGDDARERVGSILRGAAAVLCNGNETLRRAAGLAGRDDTMRVVRLGAKPPAELPPKREHLAVASLGHLVPRKRHEDVLRALSRKELEDVRWVVIGNGPERRRLEALALDLGVERRVEWLGQLEHAAALGELARCHVMALPSIDEAFGVSYVEAMASGVPAVGSRGEGGPEEIAAIGEGMILVDPCAPESLAATLADLFADPAGLERISAAARATARQHFSWESCGRATVAAYEEVLGLGPGARS